MEDTMLDLLKICQQKELYCIHNNVDDLIESALNFKLLSINLNSQHLDKEKQEVKNIVEPATKRRTRITESLHNFKVIHKESTILLNKTTQFSPVNATKEPEYSLNSSRSDSESVLPSSDDFSPIIEEKFLTFSSLLFELNDEYISNDVNPLFDEVLENIKSNDSY
ncbi:hypothetical protein Tco_0239516, partial [Tanacetum coccineum]